MAFKDKSGNNVSNADLAAKFGYTFNPFGSGDTQWVGPNGEKVSDQFLNKLGIDKGIIIPDEESMAEAKSYGYKGQSAEGQAAQEQIDELNKTSPIFDPTGGTDVLKKEYLIDPTEDMAGAKSAYSQALGNQNDLMAMAKDTALTPYAKALMERQALEEGKQRGDLAAQTNTSVAQGLRILGTTGGYDSGARERLASTAARGYATGGQDIGRESAYSRLGINADDLNKKFDILKGGTTAYSGLSNVAQGIGQVGINAKNANIDRTIAAKKAAMEEATKRFGMKMNIQGAKTEANAI
jgi:hypothetical protein